MKMKKMSMPKMKQVGSYRPPSLSGYNKPRRGRVGKNMPAIKQFRPLTPRKRRG